MKALIAMSGGVDSSVAAMMAQEAGYECIGCTMQLFDDEPDGTAGTGSTADDAAAVAAALGIPFYVFDFRDAFRRCVIADFADQYSAGRTPNPCIVCNRTMKFGLLMEKARQLGCDKLVTGHYARVAFDPKTSLYTLKKGLDETKDQSYVLYHLSQKQLSHLLLPLGDLTKAQVRELAAEAGFVNADRPESQDICFVPDGDYAAVIRRYSGREFPPGEFVDLQGQVMGTHKGIIHYTIGQTRRLGQAFGVSRYVCAIDGEKNRITLGGPEDVFSLTAQAADCCWAAGRIPDAPVRCKIRLRYKQKEQWATVRPLPAENARDHAACCGQGSVPHRMDRPAGRTEIIFDEPQRAITPGQAAVFYDGDAVLGGGTIIQSASRPPGP